MKKEIVAYRNPKSPISEVFRTLRTNIQFMNANKKLHTLLITSTLPGEGKSWVAANLAITFAQAGKRVVLIDADMRRGRQYSIFGAAPQPGLANYLANSGENDDIDKISKYIQGTEVKDLFLISAGSVPPNPSELLITPQMTNLLEKLSNECDIVIVDAPPCELVTDAVILSRIVDSTVVVTAHKFTKKANLQKVVKDIRNVGGNIAGVVLNKVPIDAKSYEKSYYYGSDNSSHTREKKSDFSSRENDFLKKESFKEYDDDEKNTYKVQRKESNSKNINNAEISTSQIFEQMNEYLKNEQKNIERRRGENK